MVIVEFYVTLSIPPNMHLIVAGCETRFSTKVTRVFVEPSESLGSLRGMMAHLGPRRSGKTDRRLETAGWWKAHA